MALRCRLCPGGGKTWEAALCDAMELIRVDVFRQAKLVLLADRFVKAVKEQARPGDPVGAKVLQHLRTVLNLTKTRLRRVATARDKENVSLSVSMQQFVAAADKQAGGILKRVAAMQDERA